MKVTWDAFIYVFRFIFFDESYLRCFCLCFKCLKFPHKKKTVLITSISVLLTWNFRAILKILAKSTIDLFKVNNSCTRTRSEISSKLSTKATTVMEQWCSGQGAGFLIQGSRVQNHWVAPRSTQPFILPRSVKWVPGISGNLVVKSKLPPRSGSSLEAVEPHP